MVLMAGNQAWDTFRRQWLTFFHAAYLTVLTSALFVVGQIIFGVGSGLFTIFMWWYAFDRSKRLNEGRGSIWW